MLMFSKAEVFTLIYYTNSTNGIQVLIPLIVRGVRDILVQILPKAPNLAQRSPMSYCLNF